MATTRSEHQSGRPAAARTGSPMYRQRWIIALIVAGIGTAVVAAERDDYNRRSAERYIAMFRMNDFNADNVLNREDATGTIELVGRFDEIDNNRDGNITWDELTRYLGATFEWSPAGALPARDGPPPSR